MKQVAAITTATRKPARLSAKEFSMKKLLLIVGVSTALLSMNLSSIIKVQFATHQHVQPHTSLLAGGGNDWDGG